MNRFVLAVADDPVPPAAPPVWADLRWDFTFSDWSQERTVNFQNPFMVPIVLTLNPWPTGSGNAYGADWVTGSPVTVAAGATVSLRMNLYTILGGPTFDSTRIGLAWATSTDSIRCLMFCT